jgi:hypothetical protein
MYGAEIVRLCLYVSNAIANVCGFVFFREVLQSGFGMKIKDEQVKNKWFRFLIWDNSFTATPGPAQTKHNSCDCYAFNRQNITIPQFQ